MMHLLHLWATWMANQLHVVHPERLGSWLLRVFWMHDPKQVWKQHQLEDVPNPGLWLAKSLQVPPGAPWYMWFWRLWINFYLYGLFIVLCSNF